MQEKFLVKSHDVSGHGIYPGSRPVEELVKNGIIILDKWTGPTSHDVAASVKKILNLNKVGHAGTLDPMVSGVLVITLDNACKIIPALQKMDKEYVGIMHLHKEVSDKDLNAAVKKFTGKIEQLPPLRSAVARKIRTREVHEFVIIERDGKDVLFRIKTQSGTYIRAVCNDIGKIIGGAHMKELRRTFSGRFTENNTSRIQDITDAYHEWKENGSESIRDYVLPVEEGIEHLPKIIIKDSSVFSVASGSALYSIGISRVSESIEKGNMVAILTLKGELVALANAEMTSEEMIKKKGLAAKTDRVIIDKKLYPKMKK